MGQRDSHTTAFVGESRAGEKPTPRRGGASAGREGGDAVVVTVFPDSNKKYLSTDLLRQEPAREGYLSPEVALHGLDVIKRCWE